MHNVILFLLLDCVGAGMKFPIKPVWEFDIARDGHHITRTKTQALVFTVQCAVFASGEATTLI